MNDVISGVRTLSEEAQRRFTLTLHDSVQRWDARKSRSRPPTVLMKRPQPKQPCQPRPRKRPAKKSKASAQKACSTASAAREADGKELIRTFFIHASNTTQRVFNRPNGTYIPFEQSLKSGLHLLHAQRAPPE